MQICVHRDPKERLRACMRLISKMPTLAAIAYKTSIGRARHSLHLARASCPSPQSHQHNALHSRTKMQSWQCRLAHCKTTHSERGPYALCSQLPTRVFGLFMHVTIGLTKLKQLHGHAGQPLVYPRNDLSYAANLLHMLFAVPTEHYQVTVTATIKVSW